MRRFYDRHFHCNRSFIAPVIALIVLVFIWSYVVSPAYGDELNVRELQINTNTIGATANYTFSFGLSSPGELGSISIEFCANDPDIQDSCVAPVGFNDSGASLSSQTGEANFSIMNGSTSNRLVLSRTPAQATTETVVYNFTNIINPTAAGSYYVRIQTYASTDASGNSSDYGSLAFAINNSVSINAEVPPYLIFCTGVSIPSLNCASSTGDYIDFGELSSASTSHGTSQMLAATNAQNGYSITINGTTLESGNDVVTPLNTADVSRPGTSQFGLNLRANGSPSGGDDPSGPGTATPTKNYDQPNYYKFVPGDTVVSNQQSDNIREYTTSYIVNVPASQAPGVYVSTVTYVCLVNF
jgi:hypothetical protein